MKIPVTLIHALLLNHFLASNSVIQIPNMCDKDYHDPEMCKVPILTKPKHGFSVTQLFQLMVGIVPDNCVSQVELHTVVSLL